MESIKIEDHRVNQYSKTLKELIDLKIFLASAPANWQPNQTLKRFELPTEEKVSCICWNNVFYVTGTDIVRCLTYRFLAFGRAVRNKKKFEEGIFSDLRNLKCDTDAILEEPKSHFLDFLYKQNCVRTQKKQKVFYWYSVGHDRLFLDALERDLKREAQGKKASTEAINEPAFSFRYDSSQSLHDQLAEIIEGIPRPLAAIADASTSSIVDTRGSAAVGFQQQRPVAPPMSLQSQPVYLDDQRQQHQKQQQQQQQQQQQPPIQHPQPISNSQNFTLSIPMNMAMMADAQVSNMTASQNPPSIGGGQPIAMPQASMPQRQPQYLSQSHRLQQQQQVQHIQEQAPSFENDQNSIYYQNIVEEPVQLKQEDVESDFPLDYIQSYGNYQEGLAMHPSVTTGSSYENFESYNDYYNSSHNHGASSNNNDDIEYYYYQNISSASPIKSSEVLTSTPDPIKHEYQYERPTSAGPIPISTVNGDSRRIRRAIRPMTSQSKIMKYHNPHHNHPQEHHYPSTPRPDNHYHPSSGSSIQHHYHPSQSMRVEMLEKNMASFLPTPSESGSETSILGSVGSVHNSAAAAAAAAAAATGAGGNDIRRFQNHSSEYMTPHVSNGNVRGASVDAVPVGTPLTTAVAPGVQIISTGGSNGKAATFAAGHHPNGGSSGQPLGEIYSTMDVEGWY